MALALPSSCQRGESGGIDMDWAREMELRQMTATLSRNTLVLGLCRVTRCLELLSSIEMMDSDRTLNALVAVYASAFALLKLSGITFALLFALFATRVPSKDCLRHRATLLARCRPKGRD